MLFTILFLDYLGAKIGNRIDNARQRSPHFGLKIAFIKSTLFYRLLNRADPQVMGSDLNLHFGTQIVDISAQANVAGDSTAANRQQQHCRLHDVAKIDLGRKPRFEHQDCVGIAMSRFGSDRSASARTGRPLVCSRDISIPR